MESVKGKVVLITGASSGIGAATAVLFAKYGSKLVLTGRNEENLNKTAENCISQGLEGKEVLVVTGDVSKEEDLTRLVDAAVSKFGTINILVNCAGSLFPASLMETSMENFDEAYRVNLRSIVFLTRLVVPHLKTNKGSIVNMSSIGSTVPVTPLGPYCVMKAALTMVTKDFARELASDGVRVNEVCPGHIHTPILDRFAGDKGADKFAAELGSFYPIGRVGLPEEVAQAVVFLASDASSFTTGESLKLDGGAQYTASWDSLVNS